MKVLGLTLSLPSTIIGSAILTMGLMKEGYIPKWLAVILFLAIVFNIFFLIVWYAIKSKD